MIGEEKGAVVSIPEIEGKKCTSIGECARRNAVFSVYLRNSEGWTLRNEALLEAVVKQERTRKKEEVKVSGKDGVTKKKRWKEKRKKEKGKE